MPELVPLPRLGPRVLSFLVTFSCGHSLVTHAPMSRDTPVGCCLRPVPGRLWPGHPTVTGCWPIPADHRGQRE